MQYAVFTVSTPEWTPTQAVAGIAAAGYSGVEWRVRDDPPGDTAPSFWSGNRATLPLTGLVDRAAEWRRLSADAGLVIPAIATYVQCSELEAADSAMAGAAALGAPALRISLPSYDGTDPFTPIWERARAEYREIVELATRHGVKALVELHHRTIVPSASAARRFLDDLDPAHVGAIHDAGNMVYEGWEHPRMAMEVLGPYLAHVHIKNARWTAGDALPDGTVPWTATWAPVPQGVVDVRVLIRALRDVGYDGWITFEDFSTEGTLEDRLRNNLAYVTAIEREVAAHTASEDQNNPEQHDAGRATG